MVQSQRSGGVKALLFDVGLTDLIHDQDAQPAADLSRRRTACLKGLGTIGVFRLRPQEDHPVGLLMDDPSPRLAPSICLNTEG